MENNFYNPYMFVPLSTQVCQLSDKEVNELNLIHDVPIQNGLSGTIEVKFTAETPFCVLESKPRNVRDARYNLSVKDKEQYYVPGSSIKGMIRSVFEIITLGNIRNGVSDDRYSFRDLSSEKYELKGVTGNQKSGFLVKIKGELFVQECISRAVRFEPRKNGKVNEETINSLTGTNLGWRLKKERDIKEKYGMLKSPYLDNGRSMFFFSGWMNNKEHEYVFDIPQFNKDELKPLIGAAYDDFIFIHEKENKNKNWEYWKKRLKNYDSVDAIKKEGIVPCFFRLDSEGENVKDLGFSYLYRQPYTRTIHDAIPQRFPNEGIDMAQALFGYSAKQSLKGRVQFGNAKVEGRPIESRTFVLGSPKPTFYPFYLEQPFLKNEYVTYDDKRATISGYKRYLLREVASQANVKQSSSSTTFCPMGKGSHFTTKIYFHNLHDYELGALMAAITFDGRNEKCCHSLGYAKPYGYGRIRVEKPIVNLFQEGVVNEASWRTSFFKYLEARCSISEPEWLEQVKTLFMVAQGNYSPKKVVRYPTMQNKESNIPNEFRIIKKEKKGMADFSPNEGDKGDVL